MCRIRSLMRGGGVCSFSLPFNHTDVNWAGEIKSKWNHWICMRYKMSTNFLRYPLWSSMSILFTILTKENTGSPHIKTRFPTHILNPVTGWGRQNCQKRATENFNHFKLMTKFRRMVVFRKLSNASRLSYFLYQTLYVPMCCAYTSYIVNY